MRDKEYYSPLGAVAMKNSYEACVRQILDYLWRLCNEMIGYIRHIQTREAWSGLSFFPTRESDMEVMDFQASRHLNNNNNNKNTLMFRDSLKNQH